MKTGSGTPRSGLLLCSSFSPSFHSNHTSIILVRSARFWAQCPSSGFWAVVFSEPLCGYHTPVSSRSILFSMVRWQVYSPSVRPTNWTQGADCVQPTQHSWTLAFPLQGWTPRQ